MKSRNIHHEPLPAMMIAGVMIGLFIACPIRSLPSDSCLAGSTRLADGKAMYFRLYVPRNYTNDKRYPLVMCLHGAGEVGSDNRIQMDRENMTHQWMLDSVKQKYQPFVLYPQCPSPMQTYEWGYWNTGTAEQKGYAALASVGAVKVIDSLIKVYPIDTTRLYVGGLSWGGLGTEALMMSYPDKFAATFPCAGENWLNTVSVMTKTAFWIFHGANDATVPVKPDRDLVAAVEQAGMPVVKFYSSLDASYRITNVTGIVSLDSLNRAVVNGAKYLYSEVNGGDHGSSWHECFFHPLLVPWLMSKSKVNQAIKFTWPAPGPVSVSQSAVRRPSAPAASGALAIAHGIIRWSGISGLPAFIDIFSVRGTIQKRFQVGNSTGKLAVSGLPAGVFPVVVRTKRHSVLAAGTIVIPGN